LECRKCYSIYRLRVHTVYRLCAVHTVYKLCSAHCIQAVCSTHCYRLCSVHTVYKLCSVHAVYKLCSVHTVYKLCSVDTMYRLCVHTECKACISPTLMFFLYHLIRKDCYLYWFRTFSSNKGLIVRN
jgi:hypothetical protein